MMHNLFFVQLLPVRLGLWIVSCIYFDTYVLIATCKRLGIFPPPNLNTTVKAPTFVLLPSSYSLKHQTYKQRIFNGGESLQQRLGGFDDDERRQRGFRSRVPTTIP
ncbi:hypothetical protein HanXRQr2_Chr11g0474431 [Helianthus annuus]|uniref:Uncharacterized protein n=1 Tax=Helianthus annuus TaxID=4232 RepID=A0A251T8C4_HELAN|nr:hypothetical protein HanXRQr2_Chr11g0474431 [Helianthus annuus]KAJ0516272.1 hypothetical protein HanHA89_Chr11g0412011 [Helianthus annuus]KAJ0873870.1 hypothetical protein HanPSC8_Chr11g0457451 [Helianthus annuus]